MSLPRARSDDPPRKQPRHRDPNVQPGHSILRTSYTGDGNGRGEGPSRLRMGGSDSNLNQNNSNTSQPSLRPKRDIPAFLSMEIPVRIPENIEDAEIDKLAVEIASKIKLARARYIAENLAPRPTGKPEDYPEFRTALMGGRWLAGKDYGPILEPADLGNASAKLFIHPVLASGSQHLLRWNMIYPPLESGPKHQIPPGLPDEPATSPRLSFLKLVSPLLPWEIDISASNRSAGVTCRDVLCKIEIAMSLWLSNSRLVGVSEEFKAAVHEVGRVRQDAYPLFSGGLRQIDWLVGETIFDGLVENRDYVRHRFWVTIPSVLVLCCRKESVS